MTRDDLETPDLPGSDGVTSRWADEETTKSSSPRAAAAAGPSASHTNHLAPPVIAPTLPPDAFAIHG